MTMSAWNASTSYSRIATWERCLSTRTAVAPPRLRLATRAALRLAPLSAGTKAACTAPLDAQVAEIADLVQKPGPLIGLATRIVRLGVSRTVQRSSRSSGRPL